MLSQLKNSTSSKKWQIKCFLKRSNNERRVQIKILGKGKKKILKYEKINGKGELSFIEIKRRKVISGVL